MPGLFAGGGLRRAAGDHLLQANGVVGLDSANERQEAKKSWGGGFLEKQMGSSGSTFRSARRASGGGQVLTEEFQIHMGMLIEGTHFKVQNGNQRGTIHVEKSGKLG